MNKMKKGFNGQTMLANGIVLFFVIVSLCFLAVSWLIQMVAMHIILPKKKRFNFWQKDTWIIGEFPGVTCTFLCNAELTFATHILMFRSEFESVWCSNLEDQTWRDEE